VGEQQALGTGGPSQQQQQQQQQAWQLATPGVSAGPAAAAAGKASQPQPAPAGYSYSVWSGFTSAALEQQYVQYKHQQYAVLDLFSIVFLAAYTFAMAKRMKLESDAASNIPVLLFLIIKLVPYLVYLISRATFYAHREALIAGAEVGKNTLILLGANGVIRMRMPVAALTTLYKSRADLVIFGLIRPLLQHVRWRLHLLLVALEAATMPWLFSWVVPSWVQVMRRFAASFVLSLVAGAFNYVYARRQFVRQHRRAARGRQGTKVE
jgi:hypothetical protein